MQDYDRVGLYRRYCRDQFILAIRHTHMFPVISLGFETVRKSREDHCRFCIFCCFHSFFEQCFICSVFPVVKALGICNILTIHPVVHSAPVRHHISVKSPFVSQHIREHLLILTQICTIEHIIGIHDRPRFFFFHHALKSRKIDLPHSPFIHLGRTGHTVILLIIGHEMLRAGSHMFALYTVDKSSRHLG